MTKLHYYGGGGENLTPTANPKVGVPKILCHQNNNFRGIKQIGIMLLIFLPLRRRFMTSLPRTSRILTPWCSSTTRVSSWWPGSPVLPGLSRLTLLTPPARLLSQRSARRRQERTLGVNCAQLLSLAVIRGKKLASPFLTDPIKVFIFLSHVLLCYDDQDDKGVYS